MRFNHCGRTGHLEATCWEKDSNQHLRPDNWGGRGRSRNETAQAFVANDTTEFQAALIDIAPPEVSSCNFIDNNFDLLKDPNMFVFDLGTSQHCTSCAEGLIQRQKVGVTTVGHKS